MLVTSLYIFASTSLSFMFTRTDITKTLQNVIVMH